MLNLRELIIEGGRHFGDEMRDRDVRIALHGKVRQDHLNDIENTLVLDELGLRHGTCRVDIAVVNGFLHGYEIKSDADTLERFPAQVSIYSAVLDHATLVVGEKHWKKAYAFLPDWWGVEVAQNAENGVVFHPERAHQSNPAIDPVALAELLWRPEVVEILSDMDVPAAVLRKPRAYLYRLLADSLPLADLRDTVRQRLKAREKWRGPKPLSSCAGS